MKHKKRIIVVIVLIVILVVIGFFVFSSNRTQNNTTTATTYEDSSGWIWVCSQPIPVKDQGVKYMSGAPSLTPTNQTEAYKYCHKTGIE
jgi:hypothetical protein